MFPTYDISGPELVVHRFDLSLLMQAAARMRAVSDLEDTRKELPASMPSARALRPAGSAA
jgi:hypothetical protein